MQNYLDYFDHEDLPSLGEYMGQEVLALGNRNRCKICKDVFDYRVDIIQPLMFVPAFQSNSNSIRVSMEVHVMRHELAGDKIP